MKLLKPTVRHQTVGGGNFKMMTVMGDAWMDGLSDRGSIPLRSIFSKRMKIESFGSLFFCCTIFKSFVYSVYN